MPEIRFRKSLNMQINNFIGTWILVGNFSENGSFEILDDIEEYRRLYEKWLCEKPSVNLENFVESSGLRLELNTDGTFSETKTGEPQIEWFDEEGVLNNQVSPFSGVYKIFDDRAFLTLSEPVSEPFDFERMRYDDGDTKICDGLQIIDEYLIRTVSVITDELYKDRVFLRYKKS
jgi:hypothetical protein